jgi:hypothetical protein
MSSLSLATAKHLRNVVPYTIIPFEKARHPGKCREIQRHHLHICISSINNCSYRSKKGENTYGCHGKQQKVLKEYGTTKIFEDEVKKCCYQSLTWAGGENVIIFGKNVKENFRFYKEIHDRGWRAMMRETLPIFLLLAILNKS